LFIKILEETSSEGDFEDLYKRCVKRSEEFVDETFPSKKASLIIDWNESEVQDKVKAWKNFKWLRPSDFLDESKGI
jgi:hypothetical protein